MPMHSDAMFATKKKKNSRLDFGHTVVTVLKTDGGASCVAIVLWVG
jgi:hypothetical protein